MIASFFRLFEKFFCVFFIFHLSGCFFVNFVKIRVVFTSNLCKKPIKHMWGTQRAPLCFFTFVPGFLFFRTVGPEDAPGGRRVSAPRLKAMPGSHASKPVSLKFKALSGIIQAETGRPPCRKGRYLIETEEYER